MASPSPLRLDLLVLRGGDAHQRTRTGGGAHGLVVASGVLLDDRVGDVENIPVER